MQPYLLRAKPVHEQEAPACLTASTVVPSPGTSAHRFLHGKTPSPRTLGCAALPGVQAQTALVLPQTRSWAVPGSFQLCSLKAKPSSQQETERCCRDKDFPGKRAFLPTLTKLLKYILVQRAELCSVRVFHHGLPSLAPTCTCTAQPASQLQPPPDLCSAALLDPGNQLPALRLCFSLYITSGCSVRAAQPPPHPAAFLESSRSLLEYRKPGGEGLSNPAALPMRHLHALQASQIHPGAPL